MYILLKESADKHNQTIVEKTKDEVLDLIREDHNMHEVIIMHDPDTRVRVYFDIETYTDDYILDSVLDMLCTYFECNRTDWAISDGCRPSKQSYHIISRKFVASIKSLRYFAKDLKRQHNYFDDSLYYFSVETSLECSYFRLPNQSKNSINKPAPPMKVIQGDLADFLVTEFENLTEVIHETQI